MAGTTSVRLTEDTMQGKSAKKRLTGILAVSLRELMDESAAGARN